MEATNERVYQNKATLVIGESDGSVVVSLDYQPPLKEGDEIPEAYQLMATVFATTLQPMMVALNGAEEVTDEDFVFDEDDLIDLDDFDAPDTIQ